MCPADVQGRFANRPYGKAMVLSLGVNMGKALVFWGRGLPNYFFDTDPDTDPDPDERAYFSSDPLGSRMKKLDILTKNR